LKTDHRSAELRVRLHGTFLTQWPPCSRICVP